MARRPTILAALATAALALALASSSRAVVNGPYIVVLKAAVDPAAVAARHAEQYGVLVDHVYGHALYGYSAVVPAHRLPDLAADEDVSYVESDTRVELLDQKLPWGIDRIDADLSSARSGDGQGEVSNVYVYVIDSGIDATHRDLNVIEHVNLTDGPNADCFGHGTHVAGTIAARDNDVDVVGVAPGAPLTAVKVTNCRGMGMMSQVVAGVDWVTANAQEPAVANMSLGSRKHKALDEAVKHSMESGIFYSVAAGNSGGDACKWSPPRSGKQDGVVTVAATDQDDEETSWSNYGPCVDVWAPGLAILSTKLGGGTKSMTGTSMSAPHVAGAAALYLSTNVDASPADVEEALKTAAVYPGTESKDDREVALLSVKTF